MKALKLFLKYAPKKTIFAIIFGSLSGLLYAGLIPVIMASTNDVSIVKYGVEIKPTELALIFLSLCILILIFKSLSEIFLIHTSIEVRYQLRKDLYKKIQSTGIKSAEKVGPSRLLQALSNDVSVIVMGAQMLPNLLTNLVTIIGMFSYLAYIDMIIFYYVIIILIVGITTYQIPIYFGTKYFKKVRDHSDNLQEAFKGLVEGAKELKINYHKNHIYQDEVLLKEENSIKSLEKKGVTIYGLAGNYGSLISFFTIGGLIFIMKNHYQIDNDVLISSIMILLYLTGPVAMLLNFIPILSRTKISLNKIAQLQNDLPSEKVEPYSKAIENWQSLELREVLYDYGQSQDNTKGFIVGPINMIIKRKEVTFIAGGNGSGKSTLAKVISQLYLPTSGHLFYDKQQLDRHNTASFRNEVSCIFSDYYLFERLLSEDALLEQNETLINQYLSSFGLDHKLKIENGQFTTLELSDGQRRRLALIIAIIEDKSLLVFDEWAADQDPEFKKIFYREILPFLKEQNKAVVVISHDDRYFDCADNLFIMESGKLVEK